MKSIILLAEGFEEVEVLAVVDLLRRAEITIDMVAMGTSLEVNGGHNILVKADRLISGLDVEAYDLLILPGGLLGVQNLSQDPKVEALIDYFLSKNQKVAAICAAPTILGQKGWLKERQATCYPGLEKQLIGAIPSQDKVCVDGNIITSRGVGTAIDFALKLIELGQGQVVADKVKSSIVY